MVLFALINLSFFVAPSVIVHEMYPSSVMVEVEQPEEDPAIQLYKVSVKNGSPDQACIIMACIPPLKCQINNLTLATTYAFEVKACMPGDGVCSASTERNVVIKPRGESFSYFFQY